MPYIAASWYTFLYDTSIKYLSNFVIFFRYFATENLIHVTSIGKIKKYSGKVARVENKLIHSADPQSRLVGIIVFAHVVRPSVPTFQNLAKQNKAKTIFATGETMGMAEWIMMTPRLFFFPYLIVSLSRDFFLSGVD